MHATLSADASKPSFLQVNNSHNQHNQACKTPQLVKKKKILTCIHQHGTLQSMISGEKRGKMHLIGLQAYGEVL